MHLLFAEKFIMRFDILPNRINQYEHILINTLS